MARPSGYERNRDDFYVEPVGATESLLRHLHISSDCLIYDPACGSGNVLRAAENLGYDIFGTDRVNRSSYCRDVIDFLDDPMTDTSVDWIISNPPYGRALEFVQKAIALTTRGVAMLLRLEFLEGQKRMRFFSEQPPTEVLVFGPRLSMPPGDQLLAGTIVPKGGTTAYAWFVWQKGRPAGDRPQLGWLSL